MCSNFPCREWSETLGGIVGVIIGKIVGGLVGGNY